MQKINLQKYLLCAAIMIAISACGKGSPAPTGSTLAINPTTVTWSVKNGAASCGNGRYNFQVFDVVLKNAQGVPLPNIDIYVTLDLSSNISNVRPMQLYDDPSWSGDQSVTPGGLHSTPYKTTTNDGGVKRLIVLMDISGCEYKGNLNVYTGDAFVSANLSVTAS